MQSKPPILYYLLLATLFQNNSTSRTPTNFFNGQLRSAGEAQGKKNILSADFNLEIETISIEYEQSETVADYTFNSLISSIEIITKLYNQLFKEVDDKWVPDHRTGWDHLETALEIYVSMKSILLDYAEHRDEIINMLNELKEKLTNRQIAIEDFLNFKDDFKFLTEDDIQEEVLNEKLVLTKVRVIEFYGLEKIYHYLHSLSISKTARFQEMEKKYDKVLIDYINELNKVIFVVHFMLAQDALFWQRTELIRETTNQNSAEFYVKYFDYFVEIAESFISYKADIDKFYRQSVHSFINVLLKGERFSQIITDQIVLVRTTGFTSLYKDE